MLSAGAQARRTAEATQERALAAVAGSALFGVGCVMDATPLSGCSPYGVGFQPRAKLTATSRQIPCSMYSLCVMRRAGGAPRQPSKTKYLQNVHLPLGHGLVERL